MPEKGCVRALQKPDVCGPSQGQHFAVLCFWNVQATWQRGLDDSVRRALARFVFE